jgi:hypothetical protein
MQKRLVTRYATQLAEAANENQRRVEGVFDELSATRPDMVSYIVLRLEDDHLCTCHSTITAMTRSIRSRPSQRSRIFRRAMPIAGRAKSTSRRQLSSAPTSRPSTD